MGLTRFARISCFAFAAGIWLTGCFGENVVEPGPELLRGTLTVSDPVPTFAMAATGGLGFRAPSANEEIVYVSLGPRTVPGGTRTIVRNQRSGAFVTDTVVEGGFDPLSMDASPGDTVVVEVQVAGGGPPVAFIRVVPDRRRPIVVRTEPPPQKRDVALNAAIIIVLSEPVAAGTLTSGSVQLFRGNTPIAGSAALLPGSGALLAFTPAEPLVANTAYRVVVTDALTDLDGDGLEAAVSVAFTTGQSSTGPAASITLSPDTVSMTGVTYQMTATVRDAAGNLLIDQPVTWAVYEASGLTVSSTGLLTALGEGYYHVTATVNDLVANGIVYVVAGPAVQVTITPAQGNVGASGDTLSLVATVRDELGRLLARPVVAWSSSDEAVATIEPDSAGAFAAFATVTGVNPGSATVSGTFGTVSGTASVTVVPPLPVASVTITPNPAAVIVQGTTQLSAVVRDANGKSLGGRLVTWTSDNTAVATVDANGLVTGVSLGSTAVIATSEGVSDTAAITVETPVLAFMSYRDANSGIYVMNADGSAQAYLAAAWHSPSWSPDGLRIAYVAGSDIYVMALAGGPPTRVAAGYPDGVANVDLAPSAWSPDGGKIAFSGEGLGNHEVFVANADGSGVTRLTEHPGSDRGPAWSPDGQKIAFTSTRDGNGEIYVMNADGSAPTRLTTTPAELDGPPVWSPDGQQIAFMVTGDGYFEIAVIKADGSGLRRLTNTGWNAGPAWSPDGQRVAFSSYRDGNAEIYVMNADGSAQTNLTNHPGTDDPQVWPGPGGEKVWSPDGRKIAFVSERDGNLEIYVMNADGTAQTRLTNRPGLDRQPRWRP